MSDEVARGLSEAALAPKPEKDAVSPSSTGKASSASTPAPKLRSCIVCRNRKVRCDKTSPCSNCRQANVACVYPVTNRQPRWARRFERVSTSNTGPDGPKTQQSGPGIDKVMDRLRSLESLVKELKGQLEQAHAAANSASGASSEVHSPESSTDHRDTEHQGRSSFTNIDGNVNKQFGRLVLQDASRSRYVSGGFWSRVDDEVSRHTLSPIPS